MRIKKWTRAEVRFHVTSILMKQDMSFKEAHDLARTIYVDVVEPAIAEERKMWEELNRLKDSKRSN